MDESHDTSGRIGPGHIVGSYRIVEQIGRGSMGNVYRVRSNNVPRDFALKLISVSSSGGDEAVERARAEVMALGKFHHPHIVGLVDAFAVGERHIAIVMDYVIADPLSEVRDDLTAAQFMLVFRQIASALETVHREEVIHRDIKPSNILVSWQISEAEPHSYLIDFGITSGVEKPSELTTGFIGSPAFASPEQVADEELTSATDRFSLGAVAYEAITGVAPFEADTVIASLHKHIGWERPDLNPFYDIHFPARFCRLVESLLDPDVEERPDSMRRIVETVDDILGLSQVFDGSEVLSEISEEPLGEESKPTVGAGEAPSVPKAAAPAGIESRSDATVEVSSEGSNRVWIDSGILFRHRAERIEPEIVDTGGLEATAAAVVPGGVAFAVGGGEVHVLMDSGARRILRTKDEVERIDWSSDDRAIRIHTASGLTTFNIC